MIRTIILASSAAGALAQSSAGVETCPCLQKAVWTEYAPGLQIDCSWEWGINGKCNSPTGLVSNFTDYPADFGEQCKVWLDPGHSACSDLTTVPPTPLPISMQADWCYAKWCYVDPCNCDASDATKSDYFPGTLFYTYATCGDKNTYTAVESATNTVGNAECAGAGAADGESASDAHSLQMGAGLMLAGVVGALA
jgi:hypothetical protein